MRRLRQIAAGASMVFLGAALVSPACAYTRTELAQYEQKELKAPDFCLKDLDGKTQCLQDYLGKGMYVAIQTGSST